MTTVLLEQIDSTDTLKRLTIPELQEVAAHVRREIIRVVAQNGGHLAANLGCVELTLALHYIFDSPRDKLIWDVGHQCYTHKMLTGRRKRFPTIRQQGGLSGLANHRESPHDAVTSGHAGTALSTALGLASARDQHGQYHSVVAIAGDGVLTCGSSYEALANISDLPSQLLLIVNDNEYAISPNQGALPAALQHCKSRILDGGLFEQLGLQYFGPIDGHDLALLIDVLGELKDMQRPVVLHTLTTKGKGYAPAECNPCKFHGIAPFDIETGEILLSSQVPTYSQVFGDELICIADRDPQVVAITAAMATGTGLAQFAETFPERFFDVGIAEQHAVSFSAGLALGGLHPVVAVYSSFLQRGYDGLIHDICLQDLPVTFVVDRAGLVGDDGPTHHGVFDLAYLRMIPGMIVAAPKDGKEFCAMLRWALGHPAPAAIRIPRGAVPNPLSSMGEPVPIEPGRAELLRDGRDVALFAIGSMVGPALEAADELHTMGISCAVVNARFAKPLDQDLLTDVAEQVGHVLTIEEHVRHGGFGSAVLEMLSQRDVTTPVTTLALPDAFIEHGDAKELLARFGLDASGIAQAAQSALDSNSSLEHDTLTLHDGENHDEIEKIVERPLPSDLASWVKRYDAVGERDTFLWKWCLKGVELTTLPCVDPKLHDFNNETKVLGVMFDVMLDDVADHAKDSRFLDQLMAIPFSRKVINPDDLSIDKREYFQLTEALWQAIVTTAKSYPRYAEYADLLRFDYLQLLNAMRYSYMINHDPCLINLAEHDLYLPHNMHMMVSGTLDLMCSPDFDHDELGHVRNLLWQAQCMGRIGNLVTTWEREVYERDFTSGVFAWALAQNCVTPKQLQSDSPEALKQKIQVHQCEDYFLRRWYQHRETIRSMAGSIKSFDVMELLHGLEALLGIHLGSRGQK